VTPADDRFHLAENDPQWSETAWYAFHVPRRRLAGSVYPLFRPRLGACSLGVFVWDERAHEPWRAPYARCLWHLPMPAADLTDLRVGGLHLTCLEPLTRYRVRYEDADLLALDLEYRGLLPPHGFGIGGGRGHLDQPCHVQGRIRLRGEEIPVDCLDMRDRSWHVRDDLRSTRASYSYAVASATEAFLAAGFCAGEEFRLVAGYLLRDGVVSALASGTRRVTERDDPSGYPRRVAIELVDALGRRLETEGRCVSRLANQATPGLFAWLSLTEWRLGAAAVTGGDQDIWSPDLLGPRR
jgi:hypothetical protein